MTAGDFYVLAALICVVSLIIHSMIRDKKKGKTCGGCSGCSGCSGCAHACSCPHSQK